MNLDQIEWPVGADDTRVWASIREMELRRPRYRRACLGLVPVIAEATKAIEALGIAFVGLDEWERRRCLR